MVSDATNATFETDKSKITAKAVESSSTLIKSGLDYNAGDVPLSQKLGNFAKSAQARLLDPEGRKAYVQGIIDEVTGVGEGLNIAKEELKTSVGASAQKAWTALCDGSVANFMATPNAINEPLFKTIGSCLDTMSRDPNAVNNVLTVMGRELQTASDKYSRMSPHERGVQDGKAMFFFVNPEGSTEAGELALKAADRVATHVDKTVVDGITKAMQTADQLAQSAPEMAAQSRQMVRDYIQNLGLSPRELAYDGMPSRYIEDLRPDNDNVFMMKEKSHDFVKNVDGLDKVSEIRQKYGIDNDQNIAYAEVKIGDHEEHLIGISGRPSPEGTVSMPENPKLTAKPRGFMQRDDHSEKKILENVIEKINESTDGSIKIYSEREPCDSCEKVIYQFREAFKKIPVTVEYGLSRRN